MERIAEVRLTLAALIYGIETDLKNLIAEHIVPYHSNLKFFKNAELIKRTKERFIKDNQGIDPLSNLQETVEYIDFNDTHEILLKNKDFLPNEMFVALKKIKPRIEEITSIRNRVMHTRPILAGDFAKVYSFVTDLGTDSTIPFTITIETKRKIEHDPSYVLTLSIPDYRSDFHEIPHNLPLPDFDETGFVGRSKDIQDVKKLVLSHNRVVSIIGDGGIGKTALALKVAYDIVDLKDECPFDIIIWTSAKSTMLTVTGIEEIKSNLKDFSGLIEEISEAVSVGDSGINKSFDEILEHLEIFDVLLIIDNLETIHSEDVRNFIREAQLHCKIVITSRIGLGELEYPRRLNGLNEIEATRMIRSLAKIRNSDILLNYSNDDLIKFSKKLYFNPLAIKWFVNSVETGLTPEEVLNAKGELLEFCLSNVFDKFSKNATLILTTMMSARKNLNDAELIFIVDLPPLDVKKGLNELFKTSFIVREIIKIRDQNEIKYYIPDFAKDYLLKKIIVDKSLIKEVNNKLRSLSKEVSEITKIKDHNEFSVNAITYKNPNEKVVAKYLYEALSLSKKSKYNEALNKIEEAKKIAPNYFEIYYVSAFIMAQKEEYLLAEENYKIGLDIEPNNPRLLLYYAQFLLFKLEDVNRAIKYVKRLNEIRPNNPYTIFLYARCFATMDDHETSVNLILNLINSDVELTVSEKRIAHTDIISNYILWAQNVCKIENDYTKGKKLYKLAFEIFEKCHQNHEHDIKTIKKFAFGLKSFIYSVPVQLNKENLNFLVDLFNKYKDDIAVANCQMSVITKFKRNYNIDIEPTIDVSNRGMTLKGIIDHIKHDRTFCFIEANEQRYFAHQNEFIHQSDWINRKPMQIASFIAEKKEKGWAAKEILVEGS